MEESLRRGRCTSRPPSRSAVALIVRSSKIDFTWAPPLLEQPIHAGRHVRVVCIGAGFSGLGVAVTLKKELQNFDLQLYEKNDDVGGVCAFELS